VTGVLQRTRLEIEQEDLLAFPLERLATDAPGLDVSPHP
jgi:hypothetical protein